MLRLSLMRLSEGMAVPNNRTMISRKEEEMGKELTSSCACLRGEKRTMRVSRIHGKGKKREVAGRGEESPEGTCGEARDLLAFE
jgi:hypothetical protein